MPRHSHVLRTVVAATAASVVLVTACSSGADSSTSTTAKVTTTTVGTPDQAVFAGPGPYDVGITTLDLPDRKVSVFYPAPKGSAEGKQPATYSQLDALPESLAAAAPQLLPPGTDLTFVMPTTFDGLPAATGPFPLVVFSHGFGSFRLDASSVVSGIASWGFVVAAPEHIERDRAALVTGKVGGSVAELTATDVKVVTDTVALVGAADGVLKGLADTDKVGVVGHSAGGRAALSALSEDQVDVAVGWAPAGRWDQPAPKKPSMVLAAKVDVLVPLDEVRATFDGLATPKRLVVVEKEGHNSFTDICKSVQSGQDLIGLAEKAGFKLPATLAEGGRDGCLPGALDTATAWAITQNFTVGQLRYGLGIDATPVGLGPDVVKEFPTATIDYTINE
ncbi:MAG: alpha/beta hydrolase family protein [Actinomycetes bacterium]